MLKVEPARPADPAGPSHPRVPRPRRAAQATASKTPPAPDRRSAPASLPSVDLEALVSGPLSRCASSPTPDAWEPEATTIAKARRVGEDAIGACGWCPVRAECLEREMRAGVLGTDRDQRIRAGFTGGELRQMRALWLAGTSVLDLLWPIDEDGPAWGGARGSGA